MLRDSHVLLKVVRPFQDLVVLLGLLRDGIDLDLNDGRLFELERIAPISVTTPVMQATMIGSIKNCLLSSFLNCAPKLQRTPFPERQKK